MSWQQDKTHTHTQISSSSKIPLKIFTGNMSKTNSFLFVQQHLKSQHNTFHHVLLVSVWLCYQWICNILNLLMHSVWLLLRNRDHLISNKTLTVKSRRKGTLTSSTNGRTAGRGNRATVFFITISLRFWKTFFRREVKKRRFAQNKLMLNRRHGSIYIQLAWLQKPDQSHYIQTWSQIFLKDVLEIDIQLYHWNALRLWQLCVCALTLWTHIEDVGVLALQALHQQHCEVVRL